MIFFEPTKAKIIGMVLLMYSDGLVQVTVIKIFRYFHSSSPFDLTWLNSWYFPISSYIAKLIVTYVLICLIVALEKTNNYKEKQKID